MKVDFGEAFVSTHSRPKAADEQRGTQHKLLLFQHTAARRRLINFLTVMRIVQVSTHSRPKAAAPIHVSQETCRQFQHTAARRRLDRDAFRALKAVQFQHTAARRRLTRGRWSHHRFKLVSTHSRPKAAEAAMKTEDEFWEFQHTAARRRLRRRARRRAGGNRFNTQPPEGG